MQLIKLLSSLSFYKSNKEITDITIRQLQINHEKVQQNSLFICIKGFTVDGHDFAEQAINNGAVAVITEKQLNLSKGIEVIVPNTKRALAMLAAKFYQYPTNKLKLIGITGTNGKTTTTYLLNEIFIKHHLKSGIIGTIHTMYNNKVIPTINTTPDALTLQKFFLRMVDEQIDIVTMEVSSHSLDLGRVFGCDFDIALMTNISQDHLDYHKSMSEYVKSKTLLFSRLGNDYKRKRKFAVLNRDDKYYYLFENITAHHVITYGFHSEADVRAYDVTYSIKEMKLTIETPKGTFTVTSKLIGQFNIYNILAATAVSILIGVPITTIKSSLENIQGIDGRMEQIDVGQPYSVIVDYAHTPDSLENVLKTIKDFAKGRIIVVVGAGGDRDRSKRPMMAKIVMKYSDFSIFTADNPRTESVTKILDDMTMNLDVGNFVRIESRQEAIFHSINIAKRNDVVLIAGKGHETYQEINGKKFHFDDRQIAKEAIKERGNFQ